MKAITGRVRVREGDVFLVPVGDGKYAIGKVFFVSKIYTKMILIQVYKGATDGSQAVGSLSEAEIGFRIGTGCQRIEEGAWPRVTNLPVTDDERKHILRVWNIDVFDGDSLVRTATVEDKLNLPRIDLWGCGKVEKDARALLGQPPADEVQQAQPPSQIFAADAAMDLVEDVCRARTFKPIADAFNRIPTTGVVEEADESEQALAAAEAVAALKGAPAGWLPADLQDWIGKQQSGVPTALLEAARSAVRRVLHDSELKALMEEGPSGEQWKREVEALVQRLEG